MRQLFISLFLILLNTQAYAECPANKCDDAHNEFYPSTQGRVIDGIADTDASIKNCAVVDRKPLDLREDQKLYVQIKNNRPDLFSSGKPIKVVLNENTQNCEITYVLVK